MPPLCQKPLLTLALRLCCREKLHSLLLPAEHGALRKRVERRLQEGLSAELSQNAASAEGAEDCQLLYVLCCFLYPSKGSALRDKALHELRQQEKLEAPSRPQEGRVQEEEASSEVTEKQRLRFLNPAVDVGLASSVC